VRSAAALRDRAGGKEGEDSILDIVLNEVFILSLCLSWRLSRPQLSPLSLLSLPPSCCLPACVLMSLLPLTALHCLSNSSSLARQRVDTTVCCADLASLLLFAILHRILPFYLFLLIHLLSCCAPSIPSILFDVRIPSLSLLLLLLLPPPLLPPQFLLRRPPPVPTYPLRKTITNISPNT